jgi:chromosome segregation ATPase
MFRKNDPAVDRLIAQIEGLAAQVGELRGEHSALRSAAEIEHLAREKTALEIQLDKVKEQHDRQEREIEHKLGLHRTQIESERVIMTKEAEAERIRAVEEAKLVVREGNLDAERARFEQEIEFRTNRFEEEAKTLRDLTGQILARLPTVNVDRSFRTVEHIGNAPELEAGEPDAG